ncbi:Uncharacterized protein BP5553_00313 [Venustampulla echinocandica]|uniref:Uncharacterized protein n=1 Tax=Venustampulla echinocandica TaxID=2656787 RepID=A0A370TXT3_9HELO|nr:Uncharacterized protein BP5553_00313 [Venustampulla echinocandica]RDL40334.1 Uncharacterized protein BP5553_00313 [Venustampulla echinocandica]
MNPTPPDRAFALQEYLLLHSQHDALQKHLSQISASVPNTAVTSASNSPTRHGSTSTIGSDQSTSEEGLLLSPPSRIPYHQRCHRMHSARPQPYQRSERRSSLPAIIDENTLGEIAEDQSKIQNVNQLIKTTLTELLNCDGVKNNDRYRMWVQTKLMDAEKEMRIHKGRACERRQSLESGFTPHARP